MSTKDSGFSTTRMALIRPLLTPATLMPMLCWALTSFVVLGLLGLLGMLALAAPSVFATQTTVLARGTLASIPDGDFIYRVHEAFWDPNDPPIAMVTHAHGGGMAYTTEGTHVMTMTGHTMALETGAAAWVPAQITHTHASDGKALTRILFYFPLYPAAQKGSPLPPTARNISVEYESDALTLAHRQASDVILSASSYATGEVGDTQTYSGPTLFNVQSGRFNVKVGDASQVVQAGSYLTVQAGTPVQMTADEGGRVLALSIVPAGQPAVATSVPAQPPQPPAAPAGMPRTGAGDTGNLLLAAVILVVLSLILGTLARTAKFRA